MSLVQYSGTFMPRPLLPTPDTAPSIASCPQAVQPVVDVSRVPVGCDLCLQAGTAAQLDCTATLGTYHSETAVRYAWSYGNTGISAGVTSPLYTVTGAGQFTCVASNSGLKDTKTSNVYRKCSGCGPLVGGCGKWWEWVGPAG